VRSRAISIFAQCMASKQQTLISVVKEVLTPQQSVGRPPLSRIIETPDKQGTGSNSAQQMPEVDTSPLVRILTAVRHSTPDQTSSSLTSNGYSTMINIQLTPGLMITLSDSKGVTSMLRRRASDVKVSVRKAALQALENIIKLVDSFNKENLDILEERSRDPALSVRKQALHCLTSLLVDMPNCDLIKRRYLQKICQSWGTAGKLKQSLVSALQTHIGTENNEGAWMLLAKMTSFTNKFDASFVVDYWEQYARDAPDNESHLVEKVLLVLGQVSKYLAAEKCQELASELCFVVLLLIGIVTICAVILLRCRFVLHHYAEIGQQNRKISALD
ncbi:hypothetical protein LSH36_737g05066, partial [Paralvinella palmiformis]